MWLSCCVVCRAPQEMIAQKTHGDVAQVSAAKRNSVIFIAENKNATTNIGLGLAGSKELPPTPVTALPDSQSQRKWWEEESQVGVVNMPIGDRLIGSKDVVDPGTFSARVTISTRSARKEGEDVVGAKRRTAKRSKSPRGTSEACESVFDVRNIPDDHEGERNAVTSPGRRKSFGVAGATEGRSRKTDELMPLGLRTSKLGAVAGRRKEGNQLQRRDSIKQLEKYLAEGKRGADASPSASPRLGSARSLKSDCSHLAPGSAKGEALKKLRRNSQAFFSDPSQTVIIYDWDDTLFPTTYVRDDKLLSWHAPLTSQQLEPRELVEISHHLQHCSKYVHDLLRSSHRLGKVILVTLARSPWVHDSCKNFFPDVGKVIEELNIPIIYAQDGHHVDYNKLEMSSNEEVERYWSMVKGRAIARQLEVFYSQYEDQSWKNIISIGDSDFERLGTQAATAEYMKSHGISQQGIHANSDCCEVDGHVFKVRTKTFKMVDQPDIQELTIQVKMLQKWIAMMVNLDGGFDIRFDNIEEPATVQRIERILRGGKAPAGAMRFIKRLF